MASEIKQKRTFTIKQIETHLSYQDICALMDDAGGHSAAYFYDPDSCTHFYALGEAVTCLLHGDERFKVAKRFLSELAESSKTGPENSLRIFGGFSFVTSGRGSLSSWKAWPDGKLFLPLVLIECPDGDSGALITFCQTGGETIYGLPDKDASSQVLAEWILRVCRDNEQARNCLQGSCDANGDMMNHHHNREHWLQLVSSGSMAVKTGMLKKVVLAREVVEPVYRSVSGILQHLNDQYPTNFTFAFWHMGTCFLGSSPERLASVTNGKLNVDCLAGSEARGQSEEEDEALGARLLSSKKNLAEHKAVVDRVTEDIVHLVQNFEVAKEPVLKKLSNVQHLYTPVRGTVRKGIGIFETVGSLHPTPAVAGVPRQEALRFIDKKEEMDRGWYAGPVGFVDLHGNGTFAVALRSGLLRGESAHLFAGAGIMADSDPKTEWEETELKLMPMRNAIGHGPDLNLSAKGEK